MRVFFHSNKWICIIYVLNGSWVSSLALLLFFPLILNVVWVKFKNATWLWNMTFIISRWRFWNVNTFFHNLMAFNYVLNLCFALFFVIIQHQTSRNQNKRKNIKGSFWQKWGGWGEGNEEREKRRSLRKLISI